MPISNYQICRNCVMDTSDSLITFDDQGVCDHCNTFKDKILPHWNKLKESKNALNKLKNKIKLSGSGKEFDCIIGMSGGVDSSYLTYIAKEKLGLRPLVFHVDGGWNSNIAVNNIENIVEKLNLDLFTEVINWEEMKDLQLSFFKSGVSHIDTPQDHAFFATMYKFANIHNIKYILTGANISTECIRNPIEWMYYQSDSIQLKDIHKKYGQIKLKTFPLTSILWHKFWLPFFKGIKVVTPLNYIEYDKNQSIEILKNKFGWKPYKQKHFESRFTKFYESYWLYERFNYDVRRVQLSSLIVTNQMTRNTALQVINEKPYDQNEINTEIDFIANKLGITSSELIKYFNLPIKTFRDFKNQKLVYDIGSKLLNLISFSKGKKR